MDENDASEPFIGKTSVGVAGIDMFGVSCNVSGASPETDAGSECSDDAVLPVDVSKMKFDEMAAGGVGLSGCSSGFPLRSDSLEGLSGMESILDISKRDLGGGRE